MEKTAIRLLLFINIKVLRTILFRATGIIPYVHPDKMHSIYAAIRHLYDIRCPNRNHPDTYATTDAAPADRVPDILLEIPADLFL